ncbi:sensor domain-containing diguanylate cyclase [Trinickia sp. YCB016]
MEDLLIQRATRKQAAVAGVFALIILLTLAIAAPRAHVALPPVAPFLPMCALTVFTTACIAAYLLNARFAATRQLMLCALGGAYAYTAVAVALQLLTFPGVITPAGLFGAGPHSSGWIWVFWHGGFPLLVMVAALIRERVKQRPVNPAHVNSWAWALIGGPVAIAVALGALAIHLQLPQALNPAADAGSLSSDHTALVILLLNIVAIVVVLSTGRLRSLLDLWLAIAVLTCFIDTCLNLLSADRFTVGWYIGRVFSMLAPGILVCVLVWEVTVLYRRMSDAYASLLQSSVLDALTRIYNRTYFNDQLRKEFERAKRNVAPLSLVMFDVDNFKPYNDEFGHLQGDACLKAVANALAGAVRRPSDFVARYGGEEFALVLPDTDAQAALTIAERARQAVVLLGLGAPTQLGCVTVSAGCATHEHGTLTSPDELVSAADAALYAAKRAGRNRVQRAGAE